MLEALHGLPHNPEGNEDEGERVGQRGEDANPVIPEGLAGIGGRSACAVANQARPRAKMEVRT
jgi:hypothetical protein